jgi:hypothetical protein
MVCILLCRVHRLCGRRCNREHDNVDWQAPHCHDVTEAQADSMVGTRVLQCAGQRRICSAWWARRIPGMMIYLQADTYRILEI